MLCICLNLWYVSLYNVCVLVFVYLYLPTAAAACFQHEECFFASTVTSNYCYVYLCVCMLYFVFVFHISSGLRNDYGTTEVSLRRHYGARSLVRRLPCLESRWLGHGIRGAFSNQLFRQTTSDNINTLSIGRCIFGVSARS